MAGERDHGGSTRDDRLAAALRANLRRRKGQVDSRRAGRGDRREGIALAGDEAPSGDSPGSGAEGARADEASADDACAERTRAEGAGAEGAAAFGLDAGGATDDSADAAGSASSDPHAASATG
ncbi:hypothetical protein [Methylobrevis pamukkalensis]|uniref:Uncharacterized protein n=1 Tax=Methylobrevis pamukkalensis TaxID=1439726 RepID=A0A1E3H086_9HYPH|nr:hypothetical protein [Methylobrevis pamukkalensis]ODN69575.1 hypothetical protein A6302_03120 [Methylobrevis pamukkalensis]